MCAVLTRILCSPQYDFWLEQRACDAASNGNQFLLAQENLHLPGWREFWEVYRSSVGYQPSRFLVYCHRRQLGQNAPWMQRDLGEELLQTFSAGGDLFLQLCQALKGHGWCQRELARRRPSQLRQVRTDA